MKRSTDDAQSDYNADREETVRRIGQKMVRIINDYAQQNGFILVIDGAQIPIYYAAKDVDITAEIVKRYDAANPVRGCRSISQTRGATGRSSAGHETQIGCSGCARMDVPLTWLGRNDGAVVLPCDGW